MAIGMQDLTAKFARSFSEMVAFVCLTLVCDDIIAYGSLEVDQ